MNKYEKNLLLLLKIGLGNENGNDICSITNIDWLRIFELSVEQTVTGTIADAFTKLREDAKPTKKIMLQWIVRVANIEQTNKKQNESLEKLINEIKQLGAQPILIKGQGFALNYPKPLHRQCGDIDIFFKTKEECNKAIAWAHKIDPEAKESFENKRERKHYTFIYKNSIVEIHNFLCLFENKRLQGLLQTIIKEELNKEENSVIYINGSECFILPPTLSVLHQIIHISRHLLEAGIGMRQICDLATYLEKYCDSINRESLQTYIINLELENIAEAIGFIIHKYLGLSITKVPFKIKEDNADFILNEIFEGGNFGTNRTQYRDTKFNIIRKIKSIVYFYHRCYKYRHLLPSESKSYFFNKILLNLKLITNTNITKN